MGLWFFCREGRSLLQSPGCQSPSSPVLRKAPQFLRAVWVASGSYVGTWASYILLGRRPLFCTPGCMGRSSARTGSPLRCGGRQRAKEWVPPRSDLRAGSTECHWASLIPLKALQPQDLWPESSLLTAGRAHGLESGKMSEGCTAQSGKGGGGASLSEDQHLVPLSTQNQALNTVEI